MKVLMLSLDEAILNLDSRVAKRIKKYAGLVERLDIVVYSKQKVNNLKLADNIFVHSTKTNNKLFYPSHALKLSKKLYKLNKYDLVTTQDPFETAWVGLKLKKKFKIGLNIQIHGDFFSTNYWLEKSLKNKIRMRLAKKTLPSAGSIRVVSKRIATSLKKFKIDYKRITIAPIYVDLDEFNKLNENHLRDKFNNKYIILTVGRFEAEKNYELLINSFKKLNNSNSALVMVGTGSQENKLKQLVTDLKIEDKVYFEGWQTDLAPYYNSANLYVVTSYSEGYNLTVIEALAAGLPIIMTDVGLAGEIVKNEENGLIIKPNNEEELIKAMERIIEDKELEQTISSNSLSVISKLPTEDELLNLQVEAWQKAI